MASFSFVIPGFLQSLMPAWLRDDLQRRSRLNGMARRSFLKGMITLEAEQQD